MTSTSSQSTKSFGRGQSGVSPMRSLLRSRNSILYNDPASTAFFTVGGKVMVGASGGECWQKHQVKSSASLTIVGPDTNSEVVSARRVRRYTGLPDQAILLHSCGGDPWSPHVFGGLRSKYELV